MTSSETAVETPIVFKDRIKELRRVKASTLVADPENWRKHPAKQETALLGVLEEVGLADVLICRELESGELKLIDGHLRQEMTGDQEVPVIVTDLDEEEARKLLATLDPLATMADTDKEKLQTAINRVRAKTDRFKDTIAAVSRKMKVVPPNDKPKGGKIGDDAVPAVEDETKVKTGDLFQLGTHFVLCGDAKDPEAVKTVMRGEDALLIVTDPPYCSGGTQEAHKGAGTWGKIAADNLSTRGYQALMRGAMEAARTQAAYLFTDWRMWTPLVDAVEACGLAARAMLVWDKKHPAMGNLWRMQHELILYACRSGAQKIHTSGTGAVGNVVSCSRTRNELHYTQKPTELLMKFLEQDALTTRGKCPVLDPFAGSGSTLIAAEKLGREARCIEVEPHFVDVIVRRWEAFTGEKAEKVDGRKKARTKR